MPKHSHESKKLDLEFENVITVVNKLEDLIISWKAGKEAQDLSARLLYKIRQFMDLFDNVIREPKFINKSILVKIDPARESVVEIVKMYDIYTRNNYQVLESSSVTRALRDITRMKHSLIDATSALQTHFDIEYIQKIKTEESKQLQPNQKEPLNTLFNKRK